MMSTKQIEGRIELTAEEADTLRCIQNRVDGDIWQRFQFLRDRLEQEQLTTNEHQELKNLVDVIENINVARMEFLAAVAHDRETTLADVVRSLSIRQIICDARSAQSARGTFDADADATHTVGIGVDL